MESLESWYLMSTKDNLQVKLYNRIQSLKYLWHQLMIKVFFMVKVVIFQEIFQIYPKILARLILFQTLDLLTMLKEFFKEMTQ